MEQNHAALYSALISRDPRFDGIFYVGVSSTGIYCRPICPAKTPKPANCRFFDTVEAAEKASYRPCLRCRPELAPGAAPVDDSRRIAEQIAARIEEGMLEEQTGIEEIASEFELSSRQIRRIIQKEFGVSPMELVLTRRLLLAKQLLTETLMPINQVALASGFSSTRRFNDAFSKRNGIPPTRLRKASTDLEPAQPSAETITLQLAYRPPFDWAAMTRFLGARALDQVECIRGDAYLRTVCIDGHAGWIHARASPRRHMLTVELSYSLTPALPALLRRLRDIFDLSARPDIIAAHLSRDPRLAGSVAQNPGLRVPGAFNGFELAVRAILGQQITVKAATTLGGRFANRFGEPIETPHAELSRLCPTPHRIAAAMVDGIASLGIINSRAKSLIALAGEIDAGRLRLDTGSNPEQTIQQLTALPGIGHWTAQYIVMRALRWPDAFPKEDIVLRKCLGGATAKEAETLSQQWRPWRAYATMHLWQSSTDFQPVNQGQDASAT